MISIKKVSKFCKDDLSLIENYEEAVNSTETWHCHHRLETELNLSREELKDRNLYFNRPASELIFLTHSEHARLHSVGKTPWNKGISPSEETRRKMSDSHKGQEAHEPWNKGKHRVYHEDGSYHYEK